jgi:hypothetical protein
LTRTIHQPSRAHHHRKRRATRRIEASKGWIAPSIVNINADAHITKIDDAQPVGKDSNKINQRQLNNEEEPRSIINSPVASCVSSRADSDRRLLCSVSVSVAWRASVSISENTSFQDD